MSIRVSVVLPTYKRHELLARCLAALIIQDFDPAEYEIIVADDAACDTTRHLVESLSEQKIAYFSLNQGDNHRTNQDRGMLQKKEGTLVGVRSSPEVRYLPVKDRQGPAAARNRGWQAAQGEIIAFIDDDCIPSSGWLRSGCRTIEKGVDGVSGQVIVPISTAPTNYELSQMELEQADFLSANCFYKRCVLEELGGFDERFTIACQEDKDLFFSLVEKSKPLATAPEAIVFHPPSPAPWGISLGQQRKNMFEALLYKKHPALYRKLLEFRLPVAYYLSVSSLLLAGVGVLLSNIYLVLASLTVWLFLTILISLQRLKNTTHHIIHVLEMFFTSAFIPLLALFWRLFGAWKYRVPFL
jgi:glycosyltransferase involved in cell wall biosynthesis